MTAYVIPMQEELTELLLIWLKQAHCAETHGLVPLERIARVVSWAISSRVQTTS